MRINNTFLLFIGLFTQIIFGQIANGIQIQGRISVDSTVVEGVNVVNITRNQSTISDQKGAFQLLVKEGDLITFSAVNLVTLRRRMSKDDLQRKTVAIKMMANSIPLREVVVNENAQINAENLGIIPYGQKKYTPAERKLYTSKSGFLDRPLNWISGRTSMLKKEVNAEKKEKSLIRLEYYFEDRYYVEVLKIPQEYIRGFQYYCVEDNDLEAALISKNKTLIKFIIIPLAEKYNKIIADEN